MVNIIVEGPDNSGKSTLVSYLARVLRLPVIEGKGPPKSVEEINSRVISYSQYKGVIFDRHPAISNPIYDVFRGVTPQIKEELLQEFYQQDNILIFCRGDRTLDTHQVKEGEDPKHIEMVEKNHRGLCDLYDVWSLNKADIIFDKHRSRMSAVARMCAQRFSVHTNMFEDIIEFHTKYGLAYDGPAQNLHGDLGDLKERHLLEELNEYKASRTYVSTTCRGDTAKDAADYALQLETQLDALVDLVYVAIGTAYLQGFNFPEAWRRVHNANMKKVRAKRPEDSKRGSAFDVVKPPGWIAPSHIDLVEVNDYEA